MPQDKTATHVRTDANESISVLVKLFLQRDNDSLELRLLLTDVGRHLADVGVVQGGVNLVQHKERSRLVAVEGGRE